jgi:hypothetical protein
MLQWFGDLNDKHKTGMRLGKSLIAFDKRILNRIQLSIDTSKVKSDQWEYYFDRNP